MTSRISQRVRLVTATSACALALTWSLLAPAQDSWTPDHDGNGFNNSFERAVDIGELRPAGVNISEQLGRVPWGFDSRDFYKFVFPGGVSDFHLSVRLDEQPNTTMWIRVYDRSQTLIYSSRGADNETFSIPLTSGLYYLEILTDTETAKGRNLRYTFTGRPMEDFLAGKRRPSLSWCSRSRRIEHARARDHGQPRFRNPRSVHSFHVPYGAAITGSMLGPEPSRRYQVSVIDRLTGSEIALRNSSLKEENLLLDPGFYCLKIESVGNAGYGNFRGRFAALNAGLVPGQTKDRAQNIIDMELGNLSENGRYGLVSRYVHYKKPGEIPNVPIVVTHQHEYVIRDWVGSNARTQFYWLNLPGRSRVQLRLFNQMASGRLFIEDREGNVLASSIVDSSSLNPELLPSQSIDTTLPSGKTYYLRIEYTSSSNPGTSFGVKLITARAP
jgi:hypothetical protein